MNSSNLLVVCCWKCQLPGNARWLEETRSSQNRSKWDPDRNIKCRVPF